ASPVNLLAIGQAHLWRQQLPANTVLLPDGNIKPHLCTVMLGLTPFDERSFKLFRQSFVRQQAKDPEAACVLSIRAMVDPGNAGNHLCAVFACDLRRLVPRPMVHDDHLIAWT